MLYFGYLALWCHSGCRPVFYFDCLIEGKLWMSSFLTKRLLKECFLFISVSLKVLCGSTVLLFPQSLMVNLLLFWRLGWKRVVYVLSSVPSQLNTAVKKLNSFLSVFWPCSKIWLHWLHRTVPLESKIRVKCVVATSWHGNRSVFSLHLMRTETTTYFSASWLKLLSYTMIF